MQRQTGTSPSLAKIREGLVSERPKEPTEYQCSDAGEEEGVTGEAAGGGGGVGQGQDEQQQHRQLVQLHGEQLSATEW